jgi:hypothetical protein
MFFRATSTNDFVRYDLDGKAHLMIINDNSNNELAYSYSGGSIDGVILPNEGLEFDDNNQPIIYVKSNVLNNAAAYRLFSFGDPSIIYLKTNQPSFNQNSDSPNSMSVTETGFTNPQRKGVH